MGIKTTITTTAAGVAVFFLLQGVHAWGLRWTIERFGQLPLSFRPLVYLLVLPVGGWLLFGWVGHALEVRPQPEGRVPLQSKRPAIFALRPAGLALGVAVGLGLALLSVAHWAWQARGAPFHSGAVPGLGQILAAVLLTPVLEEWFYRGELQRFLDQGSRTWSLLLQALLFALVHPAGVFPVILSVGLACGGLYWRQGLASAIVAHAVYNAALLAVHGFFTR